MNFGSFVASPCNLLRIFLPGITEPQIQTKSTSPFLKTLASPISNSRLCTEALGRQEQTETRRELGLLLYVCEAQAGLLQI